MAHLSSEYRDVMLALLPQGKAWPRHPSSDMGQLFLALAQELVRVEQRVEQLLRERNPATTVEMLPDWLEDWGIPEASLGNNLTTSQLRDLLVAKITARGWQSRQFFIDLAATLGYSITINEFDEAHPGSSGFAGDEWNFVWQVVAPATEVNRARYGAARFGEPYQSWGDDMLENLLRSRSHSHRKLLFANG